MKTKSKRRWFALFMVFVMLIGTTPMTAFAEDHRPTEECNAKTGDLLCTIPETERHVHSTECVCPGGESICGLEETEGHTHGESCYDHIENREIATSPDASKKNLICHLDDQEGHTHTEACICPGGELNCGFKETEESKKDSTVLDKGAFDEDRAFTSDIETATPSEALKAPMPMLTAAGEVTTSAEFVAAVKAGGEVKLGQDITVDLAADAGNKTIPLANNVTIDCNGFTLSRTGSGSLLQVNEGVTLTLANAQLNIENGFVATNDGVVTVESTGTKGVKAAWLVNTNNGTLTVKDGTFNVRGVVFSSSGTVDIQGGTFTATGYNNTCFGKIKGTMTLKNAKVTATYSCVTIHDGGDVTITDATLVSEKYGVEGRGGRVTIVGGSFEADRSCVYVDGAETVAIIENTIFSSDDGGCIKADHQSTVTLTDVTASTQKGTCLSTSGGSKMTVVGGKFTATDASGKCLYAEGGVTEISGGEYTAVDDCVYAESSIVTLHQGTTFTATADSGNGCLRQRGNYCIAVAEDTATDPFAWENAPVVKTISSLITIRFYAEGAKVDEVSTTPSFRKFPGTNPTHSAGYAFCYWGDAAGNEVKEEDLRKLITDTDLYAVFADKTYTVTFDDDGTTKTETVLINTPLGQVPGLDRTDNGDSFYGWLLDREFVNAATTMPVQSDLKLTATYANTAVTNYAELQAAVTANKPVIVLNDEIDDFAGSVTINYPCVIEGNGHGLIRPDGFEGIPLEAVGADASVTRNNALADGRDLDAQAPALAAQSGGALILNQVTVQNNRNNDVSSYSGGDGGGIYIDEGSLRMTDCSLIGNYSESEGGAIYVEGGNLSMTDCVVKGNHAEEYGGGICVYYAASTVVLTNCTIEGNQNKCCGGGIYIDDSPVVLTNCKILNNSTTTGHYGGGVRAFNYDDSPVTMTGCTVLGNRAGWSGGGLSLYGGKITVTDCEVAENSTDDYGGGVYVDDGDLHFVNCIIRDNRAEEHGGGVYVDDGDLHFVNCIIRDNRTEEHGGGIYVDDPTTLENCIIRDNHAVEAGGGVYAYGECTLIGGMLFDNTSEEAGDDLWQGSDEARSIYSTQGTRLNGDGNSTALGTVLTAPIPGYYPAAPGTVNIPWYGWFVDGEENDNGDLVNRYTGRDTGKLVSAANGNLDILTGDAQYVGIKAIWYGLLLAYDAGYDGTTDHCYDSQGYKSGTEAVLADNMFTREGYKFIGWDTEKGSVTETNSRALLLKAGDSLTMDRSQVLYAQWEKLPDTGNLTVSKVVAGNAGETDKDFTFTVKLSDRSVNGSYGDMNFADGMATFTLKHNEKKNATGLPAGITYDVAEQEADQNGYMTTVIGASGRIVKDQTATAAFTNTKNSSDGDHGGGNGGGNGGNHGGDHDGGDSDDYGYGNLTVSKTVTGTAGDTTKEFTFTIELDQDISGKYGKMTFDKGIATVKLRHAESRTATGLPSKVHYVVRESDNEGYTVSAVGDSGVIGDGSTSVAAFTNHKDTAPVNSDNSDIQGKQNGSIISDQPDKPDPSVTSDDPDAPNIPVDPTTSDNRTAVRSTDVVPKTGNGSNVGLWFTLMILSFAALSSICIYGKKRRDTDHMR